MNEIILGIVQGFAEFLPISSSGHLVVFSNILNAGQNVSFFAVLHLATFLAVLLFVFSDVVYLLKGLFTLDKRVLPLIGKLLLSTIPAVLTAFFLNDFINEAFSSVKLVGGLFLVTALFMFFSDFFRTNKKSLDKITWIDALMIGIFQAIAILPGISRSGATLFAALFLGVKREDAVRYSFLMSLPVTFGAGVMELSKISITPAQIFGALAAFIAGLAGLFLVKKLVLKGHLKIFGIYCVIISIITLVFIS
ncbi:MAG TPA: undecaprenyl-diphosphate phosphatase [Petrotogaceae bacterium]|nr:undecaprenyl-diphosphate phosphatase [Petrotogaceae bacterium]HPO27185.1 undecaprenyl-diphosphate phosphatase [Petrotogaceae bacterium]HPX16812.1 undecaprenyl-diphosphate phosphatase [Petrotogaceae bacterium]HQO12865.1 undecaprenyl-diphosphate phosphatase [Petrotogaceae bacterium]